MLRLSSVDREMLAGKHGEAAQYVSCGWSDLTVMSALAVARQLYGIEVPVSIEVND